jgi:hypothetical protein
MGPGVLLDRPHERGRRIEHLAVAGGQVVPGPGDQVQQGGGEQGPAGGPGADEERGQGEGEDGQQARGVAEEEDRRQGRQDRGGGGPAADLPPEDRLQAQGSREDEAEPGGGEPAGGEDRVHVGQVRES